MWWLWRNWLAHWIVVPGVGGSSPLSHPLSTRFESRCPFDLIDVGIRLAVAAGPQRAQDDWIDRLSDKPAMPIGKPHVDALGMLAAKTQLHVIARRVGILDRVDGTGG